MDTVRIDLGGGRDPKDGYLNVDLRAAPEVDMLGSADRLPLADESVDRIHANSLVPHLPDLNTAMEEWHRVLKPGGELVLGATHAHSTGIVADADHQSWSWTSETPTWYDADSHWEYYSEAQFELLSVKVEGWLRPYRWWLRPPSFVFGEIIDLVGADIADELMKLPFAGGRVYAYFKKSE